MPPKDVERMANSIDSDQTALKNNLIRIYNVCSDIYVPIFRIITVSILMEQLETLSQSQKLSTKILFTCSSDKIGGKFEIRRTVKPKHSHS